MRTGVPSDERLIARAGSLAASTVLGGENSYLNIQIIANERLSLLALPPSRVGSNIEKRDQISETTSFDITQRHN